MSNVVTIRGDLFKAPPGVIIAHACNTKGVWGAGIAKTFRSKMPGAFSVYTQTCSEKGSSLLGTCLLVPQSTHTVACLFTSRGFGINVDSEQSILEATRTAVADMIQQNTAKLPIHMCKINSGLFSVDWTRTKKILKEFEGTHFTVYAY